jgi:hypothetical protein
MWRSGEHLERRDIFRFDPAANAVIDDCLERLGETERWAEQRGAAAAYLPELIALTAAEYALSPWLTGREGRPVTQAPVTVDGDAAALSVTKCDCTSIYWCRSESLTLFDVTAFSGDVSKLVTLGVPAADPPAGVGELLRVVHELEQAHLESPVEAARRLAELGVLRVQGFLWTVKLALPQLDVVDAIDRAYSAFELGEAVPVHAAY